MLSFSILFLHGTHFVSPLKPHLCILSLVDNLFNMASHPMNACLGMALEYHINLHQPTSSLFLSNNLQSFCARVRTRFGRDPNWSIFHSKISKAQFALNRSWCPNPITFLQHTGQKEHQKSWLHRTLSYGHISRTRHHPDANNHAKDECSYLNPHQI